MAWHILICATLLTVNIYGHGFISGSEANSVGNKDLIQLFKRDVPERAVQSSIYAPLDKLLRGYANPTVIEEWKTFGMPIHNILQKIASYYDKNKHGSLSEMLEGLLCQLRELQYFGGKSTKTLDDIIKNIDVKPTCSKKQQQELLEMIVKRLSIGHMLNPKNIFDFLQSDLFKVYAKFLNIPETEMANIISYTATLEKIGIVNWTLFGFGKRLLCHLTVNNFSEINEEVLQNTMKKMVSDLKCSDEELKTKWKTLVTTFGVYVKPMLLEFIGSAVTEVNKWPQHIMAGLKEVDWTTIKTEIVKTIQEINKIVDMIFANIQKSSNRKWTLSQLVKNFVCGMNITDFSLINETFLKNWMSKIGNLDVCNKQQEDKAWDNFLNAMAKLYVGIVADLKEGLGDMDIGGIDSVLTDDQVRLILYGVKVLGIKKLDVVLGMIWKNLKKYPKEKLDLDYILKFLSCHIKENEINSMDLNNLMAILSKFGQPLSCTLQENWLEKLLKLLWKLDFEYTFQQLDQLQTYIGSFTTDDLKRLVKEAQVLKDAAMASFNKVATRSDKWIEYIKNQENLSLNMSIITREFICFASKADFSTVQSAITSFGDIGSCTETERTKSTEDFFKILTDNNLDELKEILIAIGIFTGQIDMSKMKAAVSKVIDELYKYSLEIERIIPQELKDLTIMKVMTAIKGQIKPLDECLMCVLKAIMWHIFEQPGGPTLMECLFPEYKTNVNPGKKPGGDIADRYRVGFDFPFKEKIGSNKKELLEKLLGFTRKIESEKEERILKHVTKVVVRYLINNPDELNELVKSKDKKQRIMAMAASVGETSKLLMKMNAKMDKETLSKVKGVSSRNQVKAILKKAMQDMEMDKKTPEEKKDFIKNIPVKLVQKAGREFINQMYSPETKKDLIALFKKKPQTQVSKESDTDETVDEEEQEATESLTKLSLVDKLMKNISDTEAMSLIMESTLVNAIPIKTFRSIPKDAVCRMNMETTELKYSQIQYIIKTCPNAVADLAKTKASDLGKLVTKLPKDIINTLTLDQLIKLTAEACKYERKLDIDLEIALKNRFLALKLDPTVNGINMSCVIKYIDQGLDWKPPVGIQICQILGRSMLKRIAPKNAIVFKNNCLKLLKDKNITFADMRSMVTYLILDDIKDLNTASLLQGAAVLERYINDPEVFTEIGKKISALNGFTNPSSLTTDQVTQARIFIATWSDAKNIPKASISEAFEILALGANRLQKMKLKCVAQGEGECNKMDAIISKIVKVLIASIATTNTRRKRSTASCSCSRLVGLGTAAIQVPASQISDMICSTNFDECMDGLSQITEWNGDQQKVFVEKAISVWGQPSAWNSTQMGVAGALTPGLSTDQIKVLSTFSHDNAFEVGKQNNWEPEKLTETFLLFVIKQLNNDVSAITSLDLQTLGNIVCGINVDNINKIQKDSYINAASQIGSLTICSEAQFTAWATKALQEYGDDVTKWGLAEISSIGSVINGFSTEDLQKLNQQQISAIAETTITKILPTKMASLHPTQIGYLTTSQAQVVTPAQLAKMTDEQKNILMKKKVGYETTPNSGGGTIDGTNSVKMLTPLLIIVSRSFVNLLSGV